jgi:hypothetical protein
MRIDSGERLQWSRTQTVLALKVTTQAFVERFITFSVDSERGANLAAQSEAKNVYGGLRTRGAVEWESFLLEPAAQAVRVEFERAFHWQEGRHELTLVFSMVGAGKHVERFEFNLARTDVEHIRANLSRWGEQLSAAIAAAGWPTWNWSYPILTRR